jgi:hypothetical protein
MDNFTLCNVKKKPAFVRNLNFRIDPLKCMQNKIQILRKMMITECTK